ncbi:phenylalanine--tRNA ligase beta subunit [Andreesenia angusta]|uniref:Phenylalanine--tRNA ligase beta subunit n=1 Tax=Andreesenia angusta TaxID=39480 RepID=A0A1S1VBE0_9FIRM|nr:phenylalanine--tRNA ligase subunit beta [Andreesenia angusta]OHW63149.1 phenylalanine--tRNA ligase beta subunit [Andreesenia angusta]
MLVPVKWMKDYVDIDGIDIRELADKLNSSGSHVEAIEKVDKGVEKVVVGKILEIEKHPDADKLVVTKIDVGEDEAVQIVTGASNVSEGDYVPVALVGAKLPDGLKIKKGKLRGIASYGMLCSADELGIDDSVVPKEQKDGIFILDQAYELGLDIREVMNLSEEVIEFEITPNRPDCFSIVGMARETGASIGRNITMPSAELKSEEGSIEDYFGGVEVEDSENCKRYYAKVIKDVKIGPSPMWMQTRLMEAGIRPTNNIVDITNYVMVELGQPLHAFDLNSLRGNKIVVKRAEDGTVFKTLDGVERKLDSSMLLINDGEGPVAIAGIMGGLDSEVTPETTSILVESASFDSKNIRLTSKKIGLRTEASSKFEKGLDPNISKLACERVCHLVEEIGAGTVVAGAYDQGGELPSEREIRVSVEKINGLLGKELSEERIVEILNYLEIESSVESGDVLSKIPTFRGDIAIDVDIVEEIARVYGFENIESKPLEGVLSRGKKTCKRSFEGDVKDLLVGMGLYEIMTYSFISPKVYDKLRISEHSIMRNYVTLRNPLGEDYSVMRTTLMGNALDVLSRNYKRGVESMMTCEIGNTFVPNEIPVVTLPKEKKILSIGMYGDDADFFTLKGIVENILEYMGINHAEIVREENNPSFHPGRTACIVCEEYLLGTMGEVHPEVLENYEMKERAYIAELDFDRLFYLSDRSKKYKPLPKYPSISRDIALLADEDLAVGDIERVINENGGALVEEVKLFDVYTGDQIESGKKSIAYSIVYRSEEKTLTDEEILPVHEKILSELESKLNISLRK